MAIPGDFANSTPSNPFAGGTGPTPLPPSSAAPPADAPNIQPGAGNVPPVSGQQPPTAMGSVEGQQFQGFVNKEQAAYDRAAQLANAPAIDPNAPHAKLLSMVSALATGLSAFGTSLATHGKEGGAKEVAQVMGEQQRQKLEAQSAAMNQRNQQIQQQLMVADTNHKMGQNVLLMATMPNELAESDLKVQQERQALQTGQLGQIGAEQQIRAQGWDDFLKTGDWDAYQGTLAKLGGTAGTTGAAAPGQVPQMALTMWKSVADSAAMAYPDDPVIKQQQAVLNSPDAPPQDKAIAARLAQNRMDARKNATAAQKSEYEAADAQRKASTMDENLARTISSSPAGRYSQEQVDQANRFIAGIEKEKVDTAVGNAIATGKGTEGLYKNGIDPITKERLTLANAPDEMLVDPRTGQPIPTAEQTTLKPTQQESNRADFARSVLHTLDLIDNLRKQGKLPNGPVTGLTAQALANAGLGNQDQEAIDLLGFARSAATGAHVGGRFNKEIMEKMDHMLALNMNDDQFNGAEAGIRDVMQPYAEQGGRETVAQFKQRMVGSTVTLTNGTKRRIDGFDDKGQPYGPVVK